jgi:hypothetical protein
LKRLLCILTLIACLHAKSAMAASYTFDVLYSGGGNASLAGGSDNPVGTNILPGDTFDWTITAQGGDQWHVITSNGFFPLMAFFVLPTADRVGDFTLTLLNDGSSVYSTSETNALNSYVHMGTNAIFLTAGLVFDQMVLNYALTSATFNDPGDPSNPNNGLPTDSVIQGLLPIFGAPEENPFYPGIIYEQASVPEPSTYAMIALGLVTLAYAAQRRRQRQMM